MKTEVKIGLTGIVALVALFLGINFLKGVNLFRSSEVYYISFSNTKGLTKSSSVYADGYKVGIVSDIQYDFRHPGNVVVKISADKGLRIPKGSSAQLDEALLGGCTLNMLLANNLQEAYQPGDTIVGNDVWIGQNAVILPGVHIGDGAIIGAESVVGSDVAPYTIVAGNPARKIRNRFDDELTHLLLRLKWWEKSVEEIKKLIPLLTDSDLVNVKGNIRKILGGREVC